MDSWRKLVRAGPGRAGQGRGMEIALKASAAEGL